MQVWGVHMPEEIGDRPITGNYACIGWPAMGDIFKLPASREAFKERLIEAYPDHKAGAVPVDAGTMYRFANEIEKGDVIVFPSKHNRMVNIGRATGEKWHKPGNFYGDEDYPHFIGVTWGVECPRSVFSQSALYEIGSFITLFRVRTHQHQFISALDGKPVDSAQDNIDDDSVISDDQVTRNTSERAEETTQDFVIRQLERALNGYDFEEFVAHLMECMGYTARVTERSGDGGVDVIAHTDELGFQPPIIKIQCKKQTTTIGEPEVHQLLGTLGEGEFALFVTLGSYSRQAILRERSAPRLRLLGGEELVDLIQAHYPSLSPRYRTMIPLRQIYVPDLMAK